MDECERSTTRGSSRTPPAGSQPRAAPPAGPDLCQSLPSSCSRAPGSWEDVKTRPCGSKIAAGSQVAGAFQDVSEELNQGTLLRQLRSRISSQGERWGFAALPKGWLRTLVERARIPGPRADRRSQAVFCKPGGAQEDVYILGKGHLQGSLGSTHRAWLRVPGGGK